MGNEQPPQYNTPATFVDVKRVRTGDKDSKGRDKTVLTFGLINRETEDGSTFQKNSLDDLIAALQQYQGKQVNFSIHMEEKTSSQGSKFKSAFVKITEMIPKDQAQAKTAFVPKNRQAAVKATAERIQKEFGAK